MVYNSHIDIGTATPWPLKVGLMTLPRSLDETRAIARLADESGWDWLGIADSPVVFHESYIHQAAALSVTSRIAVGPLVSHVVVRHPLVVANLLATLQELGAGRTIGTLATGNSAARGLGLAPSSPEQLGEAIAAIRSYWAGDGGRFGDSHIPATGMPRPSCPLFVAADGPRAAELAGQVADGLLYGGTLDGAVLDRRIAVGKQRTTQEFWAAPGISLATTRDGVLADMGEMLVAQANRALRGADLDERGVPAPLQGEIRALWRGYDYAHHADATRSGNALLLSHDLADYLLDHLLFWGDDATWATRLEDLAARGCDGVLFILGQSDQVATVEELSQRLTRLGVLRVTAEIGSGG